LIADWYKASLKLALRSHAERGNEINSKTGLSVFSRGRSAFPRGAWERENCQIMKKIHFYQIHNVLKAYSRQLVRTKILASKGEQVQTEGSKVSGGKRRAVIEQISADILNKIRSVKSICEDRDKEKKRTERHLETKFVYHTIDENNQKTSHTFTAEDSDVLLSEN